MVCCSISLGQPNLVKNMGTVWRRNLGRIKSGQLEEIIAHSPWEDGVGDGVHGAAARFDDYILKAFDKLALCREVQVKKRGATCPSLVLQRLRVERDSAQRQGGQNYKSLRNQCTKMTRAEQMKSTVEMDDKNIWQTTKELTGSGGGERV
jgi:hypothetical protein